MDKISMIRIKQVSKQINRYWFSPETMRFFKSKVDKVAYQKGNNAYFISSEQFDEDSPRLYTIRMCDLLDGKIDTVGEFQEFETHKEAKQKLFE